MRKLILQIAEEERESLKQDLKLISSASICIDIWTSTAQDPYIGISIH